MLVDGGQSQQRRNRNTLRIGCAIRQNQDVVPVFDGIHRLGAEGSELGLYAFAPPFGRVGDVDHMAFEFAMGVLGNVMQLGHIDKIQHRLIHFQAHGRIDGVDVQQIGFGADKAVQAHHHLFAYRINRRIGDLREELAIVVVQGFVFVRQNSQGRIVAHRANRLFALQRHRTQNKFQVFLRIAKGLLAIQQGFAAGQRRLLFFATRHIVELDTHLAYPLAIGFAIGQLALEFFVVNQAALL